MMQQRSRLRESLRINLVPVVITSETTIVGFLSLNFSDAPPFWHLGNITAMGIAAALVYSVTFLPALITVVPVKVRWQAKTEQSRLDLGLDWLAEKVTAHHRPILLITAGMSLALIALIPQIDLND